MKKAILVTTGNWISVEEYVREFGPKFDSRALKRDRPEVVCPACRGGMHARNEGAGSGDAPWSHNPAPGTWCPLKDDGERYRLLKPRTIDRAAGVKLRESFFKNWRAHWSYICSVAEMADVHTLIDFLKQMDRLEMWCGSGFLEWHFPYMFLALCDFPPPKSARAAVKRGHWLRYWFSNRVRIFDDLWMWTDGNFEFFRASYRVPARGAQPRPKHLFNIERIAVEPGFLGRSFMSPPPNAYQEAKMIESFPEAA